MAQKLFSVRSDSYGNFAFIIEITFEGQRYIVIMFALFLCLNTLKTK